jgi:hypothetical protein
MVDRQARTAVTRAYIDAVHPLADIYDGFLVDGRSGNHNAEAAQALSEAPLPTIVAPGTAPIRPDLDVPVLVFQPETFLAELLFGGTTARQPDTDRFRLWEVPGTADGDAYGFYIAPDDLADSPAALGGIRTPQLDVPIATLSGAAGEGDFLCVAFGSTTPFDDPTLHALYADHATYFSKFNAATDRAVHAGFILPTDADLLRRAAAMSDIE